MSQISETVSPSPVTPAKVYPLEHGDRLTVEEFERRYAATPGLKKAELINGRVYILSEYCGPTTPSIPPLENGDHLSLDEFVRRYDAMPGLKKAELIDGTVYVAPPVSHYNHSVPHANLLTVISTYRAHTPGTTGGDNGSVRVNEKNMPQPDVSLFILPASGGAAIIRNDGYVAGAIDLAAEIAASSASYDSHDKRELYAQSGIREYIIWRTLDGAIDYLILRTGKYVPVAAIEGVLKSEAFPGLWIDAAALLAGDIAGALATVQRGISSSEHGEFVKLLQQRAAAAGSADKPAG